MTTRDLQCDVLIVGGGLVGSTLALALARTPLRTVLVEERDPERLEQPSFDARATALANGSQRILQGLCLWDRLAEEAEAIRSIHISERGRFGVARIRAQDEGVAALGYLLENRVLGHAIWDALGGASNFTCLAPAKLRALSMEKDCARAQIHGADASVRVTARLIVAADGARSEIRDVLGIGSREDRYAQQAVVLNCATQIHHAGCAFERFTPSGPLAFLPLRDSRVAVVWTVSEEQAASRLGLGDDEFTEELQEAFGYRLGRITRVGARAAYPLSRVTSVAVVANRAALVGNAAVSLHPVAGQGFNLALRDIATLAEMLSDARRGDDGADPGDGAVLTRYGDRRAQDHKRVAAFTHGLIRLFGYESALLAVTRGVGLLAFDMMPGAKSLLARQTMGLSGRLPRLARGLPLVPPA